MVKRSRCNHGIRKTLGGAPFSQRQRMSAIASKVDDHRLDLASNRMSGHDRYRKVIAVLRIAALWDPPTRADKYPGPAIVHRREREFELPNREARSAFVVVRPYRRAALQSLGKRNIGETRWRRHDLPRGMRSFEALWRNVRHEHGGHAQSIFRYPGLQQFERPKPRFCPACTDDAVGRASSLRQISRHFVGLREIDIGTRVGIACKPKSGCLVRLPARRERECVRIGRRPRRPAAVHAKAQ